MSALPQPERERWQPLRAGLVDLFYYDQQEFCFRDGRLLLRGNNGTGKSKVLALTLPLLLDGELAAHRVEPDADPNKRMEWNLLLGGEHPNGERLGYSWLELGRLAEDGEARFCTVGCGLKAASGRGIAAHWFFVTEQRVGAELSLVDGTGIALTRDRLEGEIGGAGSVHRSAREHRRAVDERLFGLGEQRYAALMDLLIRIRAPQLSKRPDERGLSRALTDALPPLDQALIADVAEAFRALEEDRDALAGMVEARDASVRYLDTYRTYAQVACRRRAAPPRQAQSTFDRVSRELAEAQAAHARAQNELKEATETLAAQRAEHDRLLARQQALRESPEARSARELQNAAEAARGAAERATQAQTALERAEKRLATYAGRLAEADDRRAEADAGLARARSVAAEHAHGARVHTELAERVDGAIGEVAHEELQRRAGAVADGQQRAIDRIRQLLETRANCHRAVVSVRERCEQLAGEEAEHTERRTTAARALEELAGRHRDHVRRHLDAAQELRLDDPAEALAALELWVETLAGPNPVDERVAVAGRVASGRLAREEAALAAETGETQQLAAELDASIARLEAGDYDRPPDPHTRAPGARAQRPGAPLWQVVDFRADVDAGARAGVEAALEAAGILDAWLSPDGDLLSPGTNDVLLVAGEADPSHPGAGQRLRDVLEPAIDRDDPCAASLSEDVVCRVLGAIGLAEAGGPVWVTPDGGFRNGALRGAWEKPAAAYIGHGAREAARRARLEELRIQRHRVSERLAALDDARIGLEARRATLEAEIEQMPDDEGLRGAHAALDRIEAELAKLTEQIALARVRLSEAETDAQAAALALRTDAEDLRLPASAAELDAVQDALHAFRLALAELWPALLVRDRADETADRARADCGGAETELGEARERHAVAERERVECAERHETLHRTAGAAIAELQRQLGEVAGQLRENERGREETDARKSRAQREEGSADALRERLAHELEQAGENRIVATEALRRFAGTGLIEVALGGAEIPDAAEEWGVTVALRLARQIEQELSEVADDDPAWQRSQQRVTDELGALADALRRHGNNASASLREEGIVVEIVFRGHTTSVPTCSEQLQAEVADRQRLLDEREREILENHLVNEVASTLQELITDAEHQVARTNAELAERPTSTGMQLRLRWVVESDGPAGLLEARERLLRQTADAWSEEDRAAVGAFLQSRIQQVRSQDAAGTWIEHLTQALDYRSWHRFTVERRQAGVWRSASGPSSGGERVLAASVPLFAAASSYYASAANAHAPRIVMLDEAFAGVDDSSRAKCLGLLAAFDLDVVMTSEREWGCYREVPGLAIAQLARVDDIAAVLVTHWEWDGASRTRVERPVAPVPAGVRSANRGADGMTGLWETSTTSD